MSTEQVEGPEHCIARDETKERQLRLRLEDERFYRAAWKVARESSNAKYDAMVEELVRTTPLELKLHSIRVYRTLDATPKVSEGLLDGDPWPELRDAIDAWDAPSKLNAVSIRNSTVLLPVDDVSEEPAPANR